jgi:ankyrin repeat protein
MQRAFALGFAFLVFVGSVSAQLAPVGRAPGVDIEPKPGASECPANDAGDAGPTSSPLQPSDFVQLERKTGFWPAYTVTIQADGNINWKGAPNEVFLNHPPTYVAPQQVQALIKRMNVQAFWNLCGRYFMPMTDGPTVIVTLHAGGREKHISDYFNGGPPVLQQFEGDIDALADSHRLIHGDPEKELIGNIRFDAAFAKPGVTPLMRAAVIADVTQMRRLLENGANPNDRDSSGWTPLFYAAQGAKLGRVDATTSSTAVEAIKLLLAVGANPNIPSFMGETALMAAGTAYHGPVEKTQLLISGGANVDAQDKNGRTPLMSIIDGAFWGGPRNKYQEQVELCSALVRAGARVDLRASNSDTVFDILERQLVRWTGPNQPPAFAESVRAHYQDFFKALHQ